MLEKPAYAKINLGLHVMGRREDGFHDIETVMVRIGWADGIRVGAAPEGAVSFGCSDPYLPADERNTCVMAARLLASKYSVMRGADIYLDKRVPYGAGLGSGSSDAASVLIMLRDLWDIDCTDDELEALAAEIGSDVPFFIRGNPALATGRGTDLVDLYCGDGALYRLPFIVAVAVPDVRVSTAEAYAAVPLSASRRPDLREVVCANDPQWWKTDLINDFEVPLREKEPLLENVFSSFMKWNPAYMSLSGSGSAVYALFDSETAALEALSDKPFRNMQTWHGTAV